MVYFDSFQHRFLRRVGVMTDLQKSDLIKLNLVADFKETYDSVCKIKGFFKGSLLFLIVTFDVYDVAHYGIDYIVIGDVDVIEAVEFHILHIFLYPLLYPLEVGLESQTFIGAAAVADDKQTVVKVLSAVLRLMFIKPLDHSVLAAAGCEVVWMI